METNKALRIIAAATASAVSPNLSDATSSGSNPGVKAAGVKKDAFRAKLLIIPPNETELEEQPSHEEKPTVGKAGKTAKAAGPKPKRNMADVLKGALHYCSKRLNEMAQIGDNRDLRIDESSGEPAGATSTSSDFDLSPVDTSDHQVPHTPGRDRGSSIGDHFISEDEVKEDGAAAGAAKKIDLDEHISSSSTLTSDGSISVTPVVRRTRSKRSTSRRSTSARKSSRRQVSFLQERKSSKKRVGGGSLPSLDVLLKTAPGAAAPKPSKAQPQPKGGSAEVNQRRPKLTERATRNESVVVAGTKRYALQALLGRGTYGFVHRAQDVDTGKHVVIKFFNGSGDDVTKEIETYRQVSKACALVPKFLHHTVHGGRAVMITERAGAHLGNLLMRVKRRGKPLKRFTPQTVAMLGIQLVSAFEAFHRSGYVHRDVHMGNVLAGLDDESQLFLCDLGFSQRWREEDGSHVERVGGQAAVGTSRFSSLNNHKHLRQSRRDDLESLAYMLIKALCKDLPWHIYAKHPDRRQKWNLIMKAKLEFEESEFFAALPKELQCFLSQVKQLRFNQRPDYEKYRKLFRNMLKRHEAQNGRRYFDWMYVWN